MDADACQASVSRTVGMARLLRSEKGVMLVRAPLQRGRPQLIWLVNLPSFGLMDVRSPNVACGR